MSGTEENTSTEKNLGGRPSLYTPDMPDRLRAYIKNFKEYEDEIPSIPGFACVVGTCERTVYNWGDKHEKFLQALGELHSAQHKVLLSKGLNGEFNSTIAKLVLSSNHKYSERTDMTTGGEKITPQVVSFANLPAPPKQEAAE
ncbi:MAG: terminase small subunit [Planctomycetota bacterium]